jgi:hypothetical protein
MSRPNSVSAAQSCDVKPQQKFGCVQPEAFFALLRLQQWLLWRSRAYITVETMLARHVQAQFCQCCQVLRYEATANLFLRFT